MSHIDTHAHVFSRECPAIAEARYRPDYDAFLEDWTSHWEAAGVARGVLVQPSFLGTDNAYLLEVLGCGQAQLRGVVVVDPSIASSALAEWNSRGVRGMRLNLLGVTDLAQFREQRWQSLFNTIAELGWHLEIQRLGESIPDLLQALGDTPVPVVFDHFGLPDPAAGRLCAGAQAIVRMSETREVYVKLSAPYRLRGADAVYYASYYRSRLGPEHLLWGSDWPWTNHEQGRNYAECLNALHAWIPSEAERKIILEETPRRIFGF